MTPQTEALFEQLCESASLEVERIATASKLGQRRPDYRVTGHDGTTFFAEIKEVTPNAEEAEQTRRLLEGETALFGTTPGARVRELIAKANRQLRAMAQGSCPGLLVIYNTSLALHFHTEPYSILTAMRGLDVVPVLVPQNPKLSPQFQEVRTGPKKKMTAQANTSISAILTPVELPDGGWTVSVYHNHFAACPLPLSALSGQLFSHLTMAQDQHSWVSCSTAV